MCSCGRLQQSDMVVRSIELRRQHLTRRRGQGLVASQDGHRSTGREGGRMNTLPVTGEHCLYRPLREVHHSGLSVPAYVEDLLRAYAGTAHPRETGGLLLGWWEQSVPVVAYA